MATTIYLVTSGEYSDYHIDGAFSSEEKAKAFIAYEEKRAAGNRYYREGYGIEEWELDECLDELARGLSCYYVSFPDITNGDATVLQTTPSPDTGEGKSGFRWRGQPEWFAVHVWAKDEQGALKIANERRTQFLLTREGRRAREK